VDCLVSGVSADVDAFVGINGEYTAAESLKEQDPELWELCSPFAHIGKNPSLLVHLVHAEQDIWIPVQESVDLHAVLVDAGYDATLTTFEGEGHRVPWSGPGREALVQAIMAAARR
jgi:pimeloyl-ACP methyl ester carboxylesterase